ncbi:hypothetical protein PVAND_016470 [Polypedilum vanderplanki]|uniref:Uncharacterized protein n=1 Tax=Polypedilum vanderplanki TaxID=319348 RepID=A0A9J6BF81_POLVA|nr:hypothetical protein PVAND_016470 [Polypedilum vanderplanki]
MKFSLAFFISFFTAEILQVTAETVQCRYYIDSRYPLDGQQYYCYVKNSEIFAGSRINIDNAIGAHTEGRTSNSQVGAFYTDGPSNMVLFPSNLAQIFPNLIVIDI